MHIYVFNTQLLLGFEALLIINSDIVTLLTAALSFSCRSSFLWTLDQHWVRSLQSELARNDVLGLNDVTAQR
jgi:hypothetical protein